MSLCPQCQHALPKGSPSRPRCAHCSLPLVQIAGKYKVVRKLGEGGFGQVYEAHHVRLSRDQRRVIKVIPGALLADATSRRRLEREVQLTASLSQRNQHIVRVYDDFGDVPGLGFFYVMEFLEGASLRELLQHHPDGLPLALCARLFLQLCHAMSAAHEDHVIHRDVKPENLFVVADPKLGNELKVLDFGIARSFAQELPAQESSELASGEDHLTRGTLGTPAYMAPEQCLGAAIDHRTDIYAMGLVLYELLVGGSPFAASANGEPLARSREQLIEAQLSVMPTPLREAWRRADSLPPGLSQVVMCALKKQPSERYQSAREFALAFRDTILPDAAFEAALTSGLWLDEAASSASEVALSAVASSTSRRDSAESSGWITMPPTHETAAPEDVAETPTPPRPGWLRWMGLALLGLALLWGGRQIALKRPDAKSPAAETRASCQRPWLTSFGGWWPMHPWWHEQHQIALGKQGDLVVSGPFQGKAGFGALHRSAVGSHDVFIARLSPCGTVRWVNSIAGPKNKSAGALAVDAQQHTHIVAGYYNDVRLGSFALPNSTGLINGLWARLSPQGAFVAASRIGQARLADSITAFAMGPDGSHYFTGFFFGEMAFGKHRLRAVRKGDVFLAKRGRERRWLWARSIHSHKRIWSSLARLRWGPNGDLYGAGHINPPVQSREFGVVKPRSRAIRTSVLLLRVDPARGTLRFLSLGESEGEVARAMDLKVASDGSVYIVGRFEKSLHFPRCPALRSRSDKSVGFLGAFSPTGECRWLKKYGDHDGALLGVDIDSHHHLYATGFFSGQLSLHVNGTPKVFASQGRQAFAMKLNAKGEALWLRRLTGSSQSRGHRLHLDQDRWLYVIGMFTTSARYQRWSVSSSPHHRKTFLWKLPTGGSF